jgi:hypothetical protein
VKHPANEFESCLFKKEPEHFKFNLFCRSSELRIFPESPVLKYVVTTIDKIVYKFNLYSRLIHFVKTRRKCGKTTSSFECISEKVKRRAAKLFLEINS